MHDDGPTVTRLLGRKRDEWLSRQFDYMRTRVRICRSSVFNFTLITLCGELFIGRQCAPEFGVSQAVLAWLVGLLGVLLTATCRLLVVSDHGVVHEESGPRALRTVWPTKKRSRTGSGTCDGFDRLTKLPVANRSAQGITAERTDSPG